MNKIGERIDKIRKAKGMTLEEFGNYLGYGKGKSPARQVISRIVNNHRLPSFENLHKLNSDGVDLNWLICGEGEIFSVDQTQQTNSNVKYNFFDGPEYIESVLSKDLMYPDIINMQGNEIFTIKINSEMMSPTVKIGDTVNAVKVDEVVEDGLYVCINEVKGKNVLWIKRLFYDSSDDSFQAICDNPNYPKFKIKRSVLESNILNLRVFSLMITIDRILT